MKIMISGEFRGNHNKWDATIDGISIYNMLDFAENHNGTATLFPELGERAEQEAKEENVD